MLSITIKQVLSNAKAAEKVGQVELAIDLYKKVLEKDPKNIIAKKKLRKIQHKMSHKKNSLQLKFDKIMNQYRAGDMNGAELECKTVLQIYPESFAIWNLLGLVYHKQTKFEGAVKVFKKIILENPDYQIAYGNLANVYVDLGRYQEAIICCNKAIEFKANNPIAYNTRGNAFKALGLYRQAAESYLVTTKLDSNFAEGFNSLCVLLREYKAPEKALKFGEKALLINPNYAEAHNNIGNAKRDLGDLSGAIDSFTKSISLKPGYGFAYSNRGNARKDHGDLKGALDDYDKAIEFVPNYARCHGNRANLLRQIGQAESALESYLLALTIDPTDKLMWSNLYFPAMTLGLSKTDIETKLRAISPESTHKILSSYDLSVLAFRVSEKNTRHRADDLFHSAINVLSSTVREEIINPEQILPREKHKLVSKSIVCLLHFGRSGTGLLHSLIDSHPEFSTLPSIYFSQFFDPSVWKKITSGGWSKMPERFISLFPVLFDAKSAQPVPGPSGQDKAFLGKRDGMAHVGENRDESLSVDKSKFSAELKSLMQDCDKLDPSIFFSLIHIAYEKTLGTYREKNNIFYHNHNPDDYANLNFIRYHADAKVVVMVREPLQSCESWIRRNIEENDYSSASGRIVTMLYGVDRFIFTTQDVVGVRLEDLKTYPKETMQSLCDWMNVDEYPSLYEMTAQGKRWWGDPSSPDFSKRGMSPFGKSSINRPVGSIFSNNDLFILRTLFYPFRVRFNYTHEDMNQFKIDLHKVRPMLDELFDFEKKIIAETNADSDVFMKQGSYQYLRSGLINRWEMLNECYTYPNMLKPLKIISS
jgi:tetratricopeptide (TPR) repeat protein